MLEEFFCCVILVDSAMFVVNGISCLLNICSCLIVHAFAFREELTQKTGQKHSVRYERTAMVRTVKEDTDGKAHICNAIDWSSIYKTEEATWLKARIKYLLNGETTLSNWLRVRGYLKGLDEKTCTQQVQAFRHRWLQHLCEEYECQAVFDKAVKHLLTQKRRSESKRGCAYRSKSGDMCAVGCLISDKAYDPKIEGSSIYNSQVQEALAESGVPTYNKMVFLLADLQYIHDEASISLWKGHLRILAKQHNLTWKDEHEAL